MNYYAILGVADDADRETIRSAFRALARRYHPDAGPGSSSAEFHRIVEAYEALMDSARRQAHDDALRAARQPRAPRAPFVEPLRQPTRATSRVTESLFAEPSMRSRVDRDAIERDFDALLALIEQAFFNSFRYR